MATLNPILEKIPLFQEELARNKEILLANLVMAGEIPAETFREARKKEFMLDRFRECGLDKISTDEVENAYAILPGRSSRNILVSSHMDTLFPASVDHTVQVDRDVVTGAGVADNSLGVAVVTSLPTLLQAMGLQFDSNLILMGASRSLGRGNIEGIRFFLDNYDEPIEAGIFVEGVELGRLSYNSLGMLRGEVRFRSEGQPLADDWVRTGMIEPLANLIVKLQTIPLPHRPRTNIILGSCNAGKSFNMPATEARLRFEVTSEEIGMVSSLHQRIDEIIQEVASESGLDVDFEIIARRRPGGIGFSHPLTWATRKVMDHLDLSPIIQPSMGELSALIDKKIPGLTLGISRRATRAESEESVYIEPMFAGIAQLIAVISAIDEGICHERED